MVNSTALESILKFIQKQNIKKMKPRSQRSPSNSKETDIGPFLSAILTNEKN